MAETLPVLMYHGVLTGSTESAANWPGARAYAITRSAINEQLKTVAELKYSTVTDPYDLDGTEPRRLSHIALTFDDGLDSHYYVVFPLLELMEMKGIFFVPAASVDKPGRVTWKQLQEIVGCGHAIGSHGLTHELLPSVDQVQLMAELEGSRKLLEDRLGCAVDTMSLPSGRYDKRIVLGAFEAGYRGVFSSNFGVNQLPLVFGRVIKRINVTPRMTQARLKAILNGAPLPLMLGRSADLVRRAAQSVLPERLYQWLWYRAGSASDD